MQEARTLTTRDALLLWFAVLAPPASWVVHFAVGWLLDVAACMNGTAVEAVEPVILVSTAVCAAVSLAGGAAAWLLLRRVRRGELRDPRARLGFMAVMALLGSFIFTALNIPEGVQVLSLTACRPG